MGNQNSSSSDSSSSESKAKKRKNADPSFKHPITTSKKPKTQKNERAPPVSLSSSTNTISSSTESPFAFLSKMITKPPLVDNSNLSTTSATATVNDDNKLNQTEEKITEKDTKHNNKISVNDFHWVVKRKYLDLCPGHEMQLCCCSCCF